MNQFARLLEQNAKGLAVPLFSSTPSASGTNLLHNLLRSDDKSSVNSFGLFPNFPYTDAASTSMLNTQLHSTDSMTASKVKKNPTAKKSKNTEAEGPKNSNVYNKRNGQDLPYHMCPHCCLTFSESQAFEEHLSTHEEGSSSPAMVKYLAVI